MQGPTPVSALLHAATLVVAGPILLVKLSVFTTYASLGLQLLGMTTAMLGACIAIGNTDSKTIIAYSTMSQFGYIISISTLLTSTAAYLHISTHACFKAALFMCAGIVIHSCYNIQDYRSFGAINHLLPITYIVLLVSSSSLIAIPYLSGCISKDLIIELHSAQFSNYNSYIWLTSLVVACLTAIYSIRLIIYSFITTSNSSRMAYENMHEADNYALIPITILSLLGIMLGYFAYGYVIDSNTVNDLFVIAELSLSPFIKSVPSMVVLLGLIITSLVYYSNYTLPYSLNKALFMRLYFDSMYAGIHYGYLRLAQFIANVIDLGIIEFVTARAMSLDKYSAYKY